MGRRRQRVDLAAGARAGALPEAIAALSRSLPSGPSPEIFRRAKFDRPEATSALWQLLYRVLSPLPAGNALASLALEVQARLVKSALCSQGYPRLALAQLPEDGSQGSRELLLALSWLLARGPVPEQMLAQARVPLGDEMTVCQIHLYTRGCHSDQSLGHLSVTEAEMLRDPEGGQQVSGAGAAQNLDPAYPKCLHSSCTPGMGPRTFWNDLWLVCERPGLLPGDWAAPLDPGGASAYCLLSPLRALLRTLEHENQRLEAVLAWRRTELVFWRWMDTVLGTCSLEVPAAASQPTFLPWVPERGGGELELIMRELQALEEELQEAAERRRAAWEAKAGGCGRGPEWSAARRASREAVERELGALQRCWEQDRGPAQPHGPHRLVRREDGAAGDRDLRAAEVIRRLRSQEACLEAVLHRLQGQCQQELARLAGALPGFIWILPPGR
ncbi:tubulin epsilon and delta complex protein 1 isoform X2 [Symphalangus syndactylus]|uniref:tubulin epsilon and delta complex protein 1 isoform X2 n=1 Tax=Symphalangus syndactylus TaxID=9590 RepID=UPI0024420E93|nr:tubulin epsilon and delta complex protein 1 isoform X2 [Symphalangus syndactylus]